MKVGDYLKLTFWLVITILARLIPHSPNFTPYASLILLTGCELSKRQAVAVTLVSLALSDMLLALILGYPVWGSWSFFTYTGFLAIAYSSFVLHQHRTVLRIGSFALGSTLLYWLWTNFGTWLAGGMYPHSLNGLALCFTAGLPFLQASLLSACVFVPIFFGGLVLLEKYVPALKPETAA